MTLIDVTPFVRAQPASTPPACSCMKTSTATPRAAVDGRVPAGRFAAALAGTRTPRIHIGGGR